MIVVEHRDRFARFGAEYVEAALSAQGRSLRVVDPSEVDNDLVRDVTEILTSLCARLYGRRAAADRAKRAVQAVTGGEPVKVHQAYRFALEPTPAQERALRSHAGAARFAWNWGLAKCKERYEAEGKWYSAMDLHKLWNEEKKADPALAWWGENSKCAYQEAFRDLDRALQGLHQVEEGRA